MVNKQTEALKMAIEVLSQDEGWFEPEAAIQACKEALEQPAQEYLTRAQQVIRANNSAQEPVAWMAFGENTSWLTFQKESVKDAKEIIPLYTHPAPSWQGLSDDEIKSFGKDFFDIDICLTGNLMNFARAIEQALKEKNHG